MWSHALLAADSALLMPRICTSTCTVAARQISVLYKNGKGVRLPPLAVKGVARNFQVYSQHFFSLEISL
jgi:hypothetical protein